MTKDDHLNPDRGHLHRSAPLPAPGGIGADSGFGRVRDLPRPNRGSMTVNMKTVPEALPILGKGRVVARGHRLNIDRAEPPGAGRSGSWNARLSASA